VSVGSAYFKFGEAEAGLLVECDASGTFLPAPDSDIAIKRVDLDQSRSAAGFVTCDQRAATSAEGIENDVVAPGTVLDRVGDQLNRLAGRMHRKFIIATRPKRIDAVIFPNVSSRAAKLAKLEIVNVRFVAVLPDKY
jgi:hypothetical protein